MEATGQDLIIPRGNFWKKRGLESSSSRMFILSVIITLSDKKGILKISDKSLKREANIGRNAFNRTINYFYNKNVIDINNDLCIADILKNKNLEGFGYGEVKCEWCKINTTVLHAHHYPIPKNKGGKNIVNICPNCHCEYHYHNLREYKINLTNEELKELNKVKRQLNIL